MRARILFVSATFSLLFMLSCTKENTSDAVPLDVIDLDTVTFTPSMKGWELYSWPNGNDWNYALLPGTNRLKSYGEVVNSPYRVTGIEMLERMLLKLPEGESIIWIEEGWLNSIWGDSHFDLQLPDLITVNKVKDFCTQENIDLHISNE
jgi:hypothetical protein